MSIKDIKEKLLSLLLFFIDYKALLYCFTFLTISILTSKLLERVIFEDQDVSLNTILKILLPLGILEIFFFVSYGVLCRVYFFTTFVKMLLASLFIGALIFFIQYNKITKSIQNVQCFTGKQVEITGVFLSQEKEYTYLFHSGAGGLGNSLVRFKQYPVLHAGLRCKIYGKVVEPKSFQDFDYKRYLFRKGIYSIIEVERYNCSGVGNIFLEFRYKLERVVERSLPEPEASLLIGIMFGSKRVFLKDFNTALNGSGVSHVIAASGYNVALVAQGVDSIFSKSKSRVSTLIKILSIWVFSIFSGLSSSLVRASTMTSISLVALYFGRESNQGAVLLICITVLILINPFLIHDVGFLFSFASVTGLIFFPKCFKSLKSKFLKESVLPTLTCILFTLPISVIFFEKVSVISLISNIVILPIISSTIFWGLISTFINLFLPLKWLFTIPYIQLNIFKEYVLLTSNIKMVEIGIDKYIFSIGIYLVVCIFCLLRYPISKSNYYLLKAKKL